MLVTICGSMKFIDIMIQEYNRLSMKGELVLLPVLYGADGYRRKVWPYVGNEEDPIAPFEETAIFIQHGIDIDREDKELLKALHFKKIEASDYIYIVNPYGYIGESTKAEIKHAKDHLTPVRYMVPIE